MKVKNIIWFGAILFAFLSLMYVIRTNSNSSSNQPGSSTPDHGLNLAPKYRLYISDRRVDISGDSRVYEIEQNSPHWVSMTCQTREQGYMFYGKIGFDPTTLEGVWTGETPQNGRIQQGKIFLIEDSYGGFKIKFFYDDGHFPSIGTLVRL